MMMRIFIFRTMPSIMKQLRHTSSSPTAVHVASSSLCAEVPDKDKPEDTSQATDNLSFKSKGKLTTTVFEKLKDNKSNIYIDDTVNKMIREANDMESLFAIVSSKKLTKKHALKFVSTLADWTVQGRIQASDYDKDPRFGVVCRLLGTEPPESQSKNNKINADVNTVLSVASDDEAAKLISNISLSQMVKVLSTLASKKRRSTPLLRSLAFNIASCHEKLDIKQGADALYALACLNFHDEMVVDKICADLCVCLMENTRRAVVGSIITSLGFLRFKHTDLLNLLCEWVEKHIEVCALQDLTTLVMTLAIVYHTPTNHETLFPMLLEQLEKGGVLNNQQWLEFVWALTVLNKQTPEQVASVLSSSFTDKIKAINTGGLPVPVKLKLLNINGVAKLRLKDYKGPLLDLTSPDWDVPVLRSKEKQALVASVQEAMLNLLPSAIYLGTNVDTKMGYLIDSECLMGAKMTPLPLFDKKTNSPIKRSNSDSQRGIKVAILVYDYHDMTHGRREFVGVNVLCQELTHLKGYRVMTVDYLDFNPRSKLVQQVQYLNQQLKDALGSS